jgi:hypothetical protein
MDRDGAEAVRRRAAEAGEGAAATARDWLALQVGFEALRKREADFALPPEAVEGVVRSVLGRLAEADAAEDTAALRRPAFPGTEEESRAMADEQESGEEKAEAAEVGGETAADAKPAPPGAVEPVEPEAGKGAEQPGGDTPAPAEIAAVPAAPSERKSAVPEPARKSAVPPKAGAAAPAVKRAKEADASSSGVINLRALAQDYQRQKEAKATAEKGGAVATVADRRESGEKRPSSSMLFAVAAGLLIVMGVLAYLIVAGGGSGSDAPATNPRRANDDQTIASAAEPRSGEAATPGHGAASPPAEPTPEERAAAAELERVRLENEELRRRLEEALAKDDVSQDELAAIQAELEQSEKAQSEMEAAVAGGAASTSQGRTSGGTTRQAGQTRTSTPRTVPATADAGTTTAAGDSSGGSSATRTPPVDPVVSLLGGRTGSSSGAAATGSSGGSAADSGTSSGGGSRVAGSLEDLGIAAPPGSSGGGSSGGSGSGSSGGSVSGSSGGATAPPPPPPPPPPPVENLPDTLGRSEMRRGVNAVNAEILQCGAGQEGTISVEFTVLGSDGSVRDARVTGQFAGSAVGACAERTAKQATFPRFRRPSFTFTYPFILPNPQNP